MVDVMIGFAGNILAKVIESLVVVTSRELKYVINYDDYIETLNKQVQLLKEKSQGVNREVEQARENEENILPAVVEWCTKVKIICDQYERFINDEVPENKEIILKGCFSKVKKLYILSKKAKRQTKEVASLKDETFDKISDPSPLPQGVGDTSSSNYFKNFKSRSPTIDKLMKWLKDENTQIISICGMGGSGKTTMMEEVIRCAQREKLFDNITKSRVSKEHNLGKVQQDLADCLRLRFETIGEDRRADELRRQLRKGKKGNLVVLDDVWKHIDLKSIGIPCGDEYKNCKVLLTSRNEDVCEEIGRNPDHILTLDRLTELETWSLMEEIVGDRLHEPDIHETASEIAYKCEGLPIAIVCLSWALKRREKEEWNDTLRKLQSCMVPADMESVKAVYTSLQVSYDLLEDEESKKTFLICCLYPEYANIPLEGLVRCGVGLNFYQGVNLLKHARDRVHAVTDKLIRHSLLLRGDKKSTVKVHNIVRTVGISMISTLKQNRGQPLSALVMHEDRWPIGMTYGDPEAVSIVSDEISELPTDGLIFQKLVLLQLACPKLSLDVLSTKLRNIKSLRIFDLWNMSLSSLSSVLAILPREIFSLRMDCKIENIGDIKAEEFVNLEILSLGKCNIRELPVQIGKFPKLRQLDMSGCRYLERISPGVIKSLLKLEELDTGSKSWGDEKEGDASLTELESLTDLRYLGIHIKSSALLPKNSFFEKLERYVISVGVSREKPRSFNNRMLLLKLEKDAHLGGGINKLLQKNTEKVFLTGDGLKTGLNELLPGGFRHVKSLTVECCNTEGMEHLSDYNYSPDNVFSSLENLRIEKMTHLKGILRHDDQGLSVTYFPRLRKIHLSVLPEMTYLFTLSVALSLVCLESLHIEYCKNLQQVIFNPWPSASASTNENKIVFPKLTNLILGNVDSLTGFSQGNNLQVEFPQLKVLKVEKLEKFKTFCSDEIKPTTQFQSLVNNKVEFSSLADLTITSLNIKEVWRGQSASDLSNQSELQGLYIQLCHKMEQVISIQRQPPSVPTMKERIQFSKLKELILFRMNRLALLCKGVDHLEFPQLRVLRLHSLTSFQTFCSEDTPDHGTPDLFNEKVMFPSLETLEISELELVKVLWSTKLPSNHFGKLMYLKVDQCHELLNIFPSNLQRIFPYIERLEVKNCDKLEQVWGYRGVQFQYLKSIYVYGCPKLKNLCSFYTFKGFLSLQVADISHCKIMETVVEDEHSYEKRISLNNLEEVKLESLTNLIYFSQTKCDMELRELNQVIVKRCPEMKTFSRSSVSTPNLEFPLLDDRKYWSGDLNRTIRYWFEAGNLVADLERLEANTKDDQSDTKLNRLHDINETMYYKALIAKRGMYISAADRGKMMSMVNEWPADQVDIIFIADGSRIFGLCDLGVQGIGIAKRKLDLDVAAAGINPQSILRIIIDVETNNKSLLKDPSYLVLQQHRVDGDEYIAAIDEFMEVVFTRWPHVIVQFEDFQSKWAFKLLQRYRYIYRMFNDDIQGTAGVIIAGILGAVKAQEKPKDDFLKQKIVAAVAGSAGIGVLNAAMRIMAHKSERSQFWVVDAKGLVTEERENIDEDAKLFARKSKDIGGQGFREGASLAEVVRKVKPDVLLGLSAVGGLFSKEVLEALKGSTSKRPAIFAMSHVETNAECTPEEAFSIVGDNVIFASGSSFANVKLGNGHTGHSNQGNNMYLYPGIGLGTLLSGSRVVSYGMLQAAAECLAAYMTDEDVLKGIIYPSISRIHDITKQVAASVISAAIEEDLAEGYHEMDAYELSKLNKDDILCYVENNVWNPKIQH